MISAQSEREKALAILQRVKESEGSRPFSESIKARTANAFSLSTSFDIETGDLKRTSPIYELGFLHEGKDSVVAFGRPTEIGGGRQAAFSPFTKAKLKERFGSLFNARATFTQEGLRQKDIPAFALSQLKGRDVWVQNLPFERSFLSARMGKWDFTSWAVDAKLESFTGDSGLYATNPGLKRALHQANINQSSLSSLDNYLGSWGKVFDQFKGALEGPRIEGSTRVFDLMDLTRSVFAMAQTKGHMEKTGELFAGSSIEALSQAIFKMPEPHSALGDAVLQSEISKYMYSTGLSLQEGTLSDHQKDFFRRIGSIQKGLKQEGATKNIIDTFVSQQRFLYSHDPEDLASATIGSQTKLSRGNIQVLQPDGSYSEEPFEFTQRKRGDSTRLTTNIEDFIKGRSLEQSQRHGIQVDYDAAHKAARSLYIDRYQQALHEAGGDTRKALEATGDALASAGDTLKGRVSTLLEREAPKVGIGQTIKANWKLGAVALAGIGILGHLFSGKDDEYNYIEGLRHTGFSGESRAVNTDFGSGWRGLIGFSAKHGENLTPRREMALETLAFVTSSRASDRAGFYSRVPSTIQSEMEKSVSMGQDYPVFINRDVFVARENTYRDISGALAGLSSMEEASQAAQGSNWWGRLFNKKGIARSQDRVQSLRQTQADLMTPGEDIKATILHERFHQKVQNDVGAYKEVKAAIVPEEFSRIFRETKYGPEDTIAEEFLAHKLQYQRYPRTLRGSPFRSVFEGGVSGRPSSNTSGNVIPGFSEQGIAAATRKISTDFGSPWQGLKSWISKYGDDYFAHVMNKDMAPAVLRSRELISGEAVFRSGVMTHHRDMTVPLTRRSWSQMPQLTPEDIQHIGEAPVATLVERGGKQLIKPGGISFLDQIARRERVEQVASRYNLTTNRVLVAADEQVAVPSGRGVYQQLEELSSQIRGSVEERFNILSDGRRALLGDEQELTATIRGLGGEVAWSYGETAAIYGGRDRVTTLNLGGGEFAGPVPWGPSRGGLSLNDPEALILGPRALLEPFKDQYKNIVYKESLSPEEVKLFSGTGLPGFPEGGVAGANRKGNTNFGSPWQGQGRIDDENASRLSKRHTVGLNPNFQGSIGIRDVPSFRVEDADTVQAMFLMGSNMNLRLAGIDAPETEHEGFLGRIAQQQPFGQEAAARLQEILGQQESISAVFDPNAEGSYGRAPAVLFGDNGLNINLQLVQEGMAAALPFGAASDRIFDTNEFRKAQRDAQANQRGMWADAGWQAVYRGQSQAKTKLTHTSLTQPERVYENFRTAGSLMRLQNPDAELSEMQAAGGKDDFNIIEGLKHGWAQGNREFNIGDFGSGYIIDKTVNVMKKNTKTKRDLMKGQALARSQCRAMMDPENWTKHHVG